MAKFVVAGRSDCPYYARAELIGDRLAKNLKKFKLHKIMIQPDEWEKWLKETCKEKGWQFSKSPIVWRELIDRGGKGVLIGGANEFQEYVKAYYDLESDMNSYDMRTVSGENKVTKDELDQEAQECKALSKPVHVCITNASNPMCYHLLNILTSGDVLGPDIEMTLRLLVNSEDEVESVTGMAMEAEDLAHHLLRGVKICTSPHEAFENCSYIISLDELAKQPEETLKDCLTRNEEFFSKFATIINHKALQTCKVLLSGSGPVNFNAGVVLKNAPSLARQNIVAVSTIVENNAKSVVGERLNVNPAGVVDLLIWGNVSGCHYIDVTKCRVHNYDGAVWGPYWYSVDAVEMIHENKWILKEFPGLVDSRNEKVAGAMQRSTSLSSANALASTLKHWCRGSPSGQMFSLGVYSEGWYGVPRGLFFSFPVTMDPKGYWHVVQDSELTPEVKEGIVKAVEDLVREEKIFTGEVKEEIPAEEPGKTGSTDESSESPKPATDAETSATPAEAAGAEATPADGTTTAQPAEGDNTAAAAAAAD
ncbi:putative malate dehydrogenase 1B, partial [Aplysia californica]|uniref:Malate dehydrogenase 1B n=1 Tax=Aplysia californica TaxID=6500 RepID=A0ABM0K7L5_APLCA